MAEERSRTFAWTLLFLLAIPVLCLQGCGDSDDETARPRYDKSYWSTDKIPPLSIVPKFLGEIGAKSYPVAEAPQEAPLLRWDFSKPVVHAYDYAQKMEETRHLAKVGGGDGPIVTAYTAMAAVLLIKGEGNGTATLVMKDVAQKIDDGGKELTIKSQAPPFVIQGVKEDGSMKTDNNFAQLLSWSLSSPPPKPLRVGESVAILERTSFGTLDGTIVPVEGTSTITLTKYVTIDGRRCARLDRDIDVSKFDVPDDLVGTHEFLLKGKSVSYFDIEQRCFVSVELAFAMHMKADEPLPKTEMEGEKPPAGSPGNIRTMTRADMLIHLTLNPKRAAAERKK